MTAALRTEGLRVAFGGVVAVDAVDLDVAAGELVGLIGPNGAGKTTTVDAVSGFVPHAGRVLIGGVDVSGAPPHRRVRAGLARTWQSVELHDDLTVAQHCRLAAEPSTAAGLLRDLVVPRRHGAGDGVAEVLELLELTEVADRPATSLPHGRQKLVGVARALASRPAVLLLDEPAAGLAPDEREALGRRLRDLVADGLAAVLIDHDTDLVLSVCDRVLVLDFGSVIAEGPPERIRSDPRVLDAYLGVGSNHREDPG